jgi:hypothetical protein
MTSITGGKGYQKIGERGCPPLYQVKEIPQKPVVMCEPQMTPYSGCEEGHYHMKHEGHDVWGGSYWAYFFVFFVIILIVIFASFWMGKPEFCQTLDGTGNPCGEVDVCSAFVYALLLAFVVSIIVYILVCTVKGIRCC